MVMLKLKFNKRASISNYYLLLNESRKQGTQQVSTWGTKNVKCLHNFQVHYFYVSQVQY